MLSFFPTTKLSNFLTCGNFPLFSVFHTEAEKGSCAAFLAILVAQLKNQGSTNQTQLFSLGVRSWWHREGVQAGDCLWEEGLPDPFWGTEAAGPVALESRISHQRMLAAQVNSYGPAPGGPLRAVPQHECECRPWLSSMEPESPLLKDSESCPGSQADSFSAQTATTLVSIAWD